MATPTFPTVGANIDVDVGGELVEKPRVLTAQFGNGYAQRAGDGLNNITAEMSVSWSNLTRAEANTILDFLRDQQGYQAFYWTVPGETDQRLWTCGEWHRQIVEATLDTVTATFTQVFTP